MKVLLEKLTSIHQNMRTDTFEGEALQLPAPGQQFQMYGEGLTEGTRYLVTSPVESVQEDGVFYTKNSTYRITVLDQNPASDE